jgi:hypothetical protein
MLSHEKKGHHAEQIRSDLHRCARHSESSVRDRAGRRKWRYQAMILEVEERSIPELEENHTERRGEVRFKRSP